MKYARRSRTLPCPVPPPEQAPSVRPRQPPPPLQTSRARPAPSPSSELFLPLTCGHRSASLLRLQAKRTQPTACPRMTYPRLMRRLTRMSRRRRSSEDVHGSNQAEGAMREEAKQDLHTFGNHSNRILSVYLVRNTYTPIIRLNATICSCSSLRMCLSYVICSYALPCSHYIWFAYPLQLVS